MTSLMENVDDRYAGVDIDSLLNGQRRPLSFERKKALYEAPEFIQRLNGEETVMEGQSLCIECKIRGFPVPSLRWFKDDEEILDHPRIHVESDGIGGYYLFIDHVTRGDEAAYRCRAENVEGACSSFFFLSVKGKPKRRDTMPSWRTVSFPPMFSTIVEKVEEEEKQGKECDELPPSPQTEFYYVLTLKSRCSWPTFLGDWAFVNNCHPFKRHSNSSDNDDVVDTEDDGEEDDEIFDTFFIPSGDICDKLKPHNSSKAHFAAKRSSRKSALSAKAKVKKQKLGNKIDNTTEGGNNNIGSSRVFENKNQKNKSNFESDLEVNGMQETTLFENVEIASRLQGRNAVNDGIKITTKEEITMPSLTFYNETKDADKIQLTQNEHLKEGKTETNENIYNQSKNVNRIETDKGVSLRTCREEDTEFLNQDMNHVLATLQKGKEKDNAERENKFITQLVSDNLEEYNREVNRDKISKKMSNKPDDLCLWKSGGKGISNADELVGLNVKASLGTSPEPEPFRMFKSDSTENGSVNNNKEINKSLNVLSAQKEKSPLRRSEASAEGSIGQEKLRQSNDKQMSAIKDNRWSTGTENTIGSYTRCHKLSVEGEYGNYPLRQNRYRDSRVQQTQVRCGDRLEELRQQEMKRMEELKQEELKRMEELRQEGNVSNTYKYKRTRTHREDVRERERKQIEELRRKEQLLREELQQKEQQQLEDLRKREGSLIEEMKLKEHTFSDSLTCYQQEQREESLTKQREELRLKEQNQMEEFILKESMQIEDLKTYERKLVDEMKINDRNYFENFNQETELQKEEDEEEAERKQIKERNIRLHIKKEQMRKEQLRRQHEEEMRQRLKKEEEARRQRILSQELAKENRIMNKLCKRSISLHEGNVRASGNIFSKTSFSNTETKPRLVFRMNSMEDTDLSLTKRHDSLTSVTNSFTNSLDRSLRKTSQRFTNTNYDELFNQPRSVSEKHSYLTEIKNKENYSGHANNTSGYRKTEVTSDSRENDLSSPFCNMYANPLNQSKVHKPLSFASFFAIEESRAPKPSLRTHEDLFKLAENIAAKRDRFHEYISHCSLEGNVSSLPANNEKITYFHHREADLNHGVHIRKQASDNSDDRGRAADARYRNGTDHSVDKSIPEPKNQEESSPSLLASNPKDGTACDPAVIEIRPFLYNSARTTARRFYQKE